MANGDLSQELQEALFLLFTTDDGLKKIIADRVYDFVPQGCSFPFLKIGDDTWHDGGDKTCAGQEGTITFHCFSRKRMTYSECTAVKRRLVTLLHEQPIGMGDGQCVLCRFDYSNELQDSDGITLHGITRFRFIVSETSEIQEG